MTPEEVNGTYYINCAVVRTKLALIGKVQLYKQVVNKDCRTPLIEQLHRINKRIYGA